MSTIVGIDLGTTQSTLAFTTCKKLDIQQQEISQLISSDTEAKKLSLPSFYLFPLEDEKPCVGWYSKERGAELAERVIGSAKSWLCHDAIDRRSPFLPLSDFEKKRSPIEVCTSFLSHLRADWEHSFPDLPLADQTVLVTVPASFDPSARQLVQEATEAAGLKEVILMEEPLAAFYAWLYKHQENWREKLKVGDVVLVVDIGGGTTDFSLIGVEEKGGDLLLERKAVGNHLLLGGDNIDLALAHFVQNKLSESLDEWQFQSLVHSCRRAKEELLGPTAPESIDVIIQKRSSRVIGGSIKVTLTKEEVETLLVEGFFPKIPFETLITEEKRSAIAKIGLPFARDPRISAQLAHFLFSSGLMPTTVLFNGGTMKADPFQKRILSLLSEWRGEEVKSLEGADFDFGVSRGAVYYGWARANQGIRVRAGTSRSYFIGIESSAPAVPGMPAPIKPVCIVPFGMEEGTEHILEDQTFSLRLEEAAVFRFFSQNIPNQETLAELHPIETELHAQGEEGKSVLVKLKAKVTELGVLELWCVSEDGRKWRLEFDIRKDESIAST